MRIILSSENFLIFIKRTLQQLVSTPSSNITADKIISLCEVIDVDDRT